MMTIDTTFGILAMLIILISIGLTLWILISMITIYIKDLISWLRKLIGGKSNGRRK